MFGAKSERKHQEPNHKNQLSFKSETENSKSEKEALRIKLNKTQIRNLKGDRLWAFSFEQIKYYLLPYAYLKSKTDTTIN